MSTKAEIVLDCFFTEGPMRIVTYRLDGVTLGEGDPGFEEALRRLEALPQGSYVLVCHPFLFTTGAGSPRDVLPFSHRIAEWDSVVMRKDLHVAFQLMQSPDDSRSA